MLPFEDLFSKYGHILTGNLHLLNKFWKKNFCFSVLSQQTFTYSKSTIATLEKMCTMFGVNNKGNDVIDVVLGFYC